MTDRQKVSVLLQAAGLLSLLARSGWRLGGWQASLVSAEGRLFVAREGVVRGRFALSPQAQLADLVERLFGAGPLAGRGEARGAVRRLVDSWQFLLSPRSANDLVAQILEAAPFLWEAPFVASRQGLAGSFGGAAGGDLPPQLWVAGPAAFRRRVLSRCGTLPSLQAWLAGDEARRLWDREEEGSPADLAAAGRFRAAIAAWERCAKVGERERLEWARACLALGRYEAGLAVLEGLDGPEALALTARLQLHLGSLGGARATLKRLPRSALTAPHLVEVADVAARVFANRGEPERAEPWVRGALVSAAEAGGLDLLRARLVAAGAAWDRGDLEAMDRWLEESRPALAEPSLAWRWYQARGWRAMAEAGGAAVEPMARALRSGRRLQSRPEAASLWNELGIARAMQGDLAGADRAFVHAVRLELGCDGPRKNTLALYNLAEIRLRRGRLKGVAEILARSEAENRKAGNLRGLTQDAELNARLELAQGRPEAALAICRDALAALSRRGLEWRRAELRLFSARALGWLGRREEAQAELEGLGPRVFAELEPEERPALLAQAGLVERALAVAAETEWSPLFAPLIAGEIPPLRSWAALAPLEPFRAARLIFDVETLVPGISPPEERRRAIEVLKAVGAAGLARQLERRDPGLWVALADLWEGTTDGLPGVASLLAAAGFPEARLTWSEAGRERVLLEGTGGAVEIERALPSGRLRLSAGRSGEALEALLALAVRQLLLAASPPAIAFAAIEEPAESGDLIGESPELRAALKRIARLAPADMPILIQGESGTGKELAARQIHRQSRRAGGVFLAVNCAALSETLLLSDLFGHARGAFTGADRERKGVFESAQGGTVFLDEIGDLPLAAQGLLLRVLQEGEFRRLGESAVRRVDVRVLAATHRDLGRMVDEGSFRRDLFFRLKVGSVWLPPLRDRGNDVLQISERLLAAQRSIVPLRLSQEARRRLVAHRWPGNVRELENVLTVAAALTEDGLIGPEHLELPNGEGGSLSSYHQQVESLRRRLVETALDETGGNRAEAARKLGVSRQALSYLVKQLGVARSARRA